MAPPAGTSAVAQSPRLQHRNFVCAALLQWPLYASQPAPPRPSTLFISFNEVPFDTPDEDVNTFQMDLALFSARFEFICNSSSAVRVTSFTSAYQC